MNKAAGSSTGFVNRVTQWTITNKNEANPRLVKGQMMKGLKQRFSGWFNR